MNNFSQHLPELPTPPQPTPPAPRRDWQWLKGLMTFLLVLLVIGMCVIFATRFQVHRVTGTITVQRQTGDVDISKTILRGISMVSANEGWAVGATTGPGQPQGIILHYHNGTWKQYHGYQTYKPLYAVALLEDGTGWAVGDQGAIVRFKGDEWSSVYDASKLTTPFTSLALWGNSDGWAAGDALYHFQEYQWTLYTTATPLPHISSLALVSPFEGWAVGTGGVILHYAQNIWQIAVSDSGVNALSLAMDSPSDGWAVGGNGAQGNALHYHDGQWEPAHIGDTTTVLYTVTMLSESEGWAAGASGPSGAIFHYLSGHWTRVTSPAPVVPHALAMVSPSEGWAAGENGLLLHYANGTWC
jgi:hypothetical protein